MSFNFINLVYFRYKLFLSINNQLKNIFIKGGYSFLLKLLFYKLVMNNLLKISLIKNKEIKNKEIKKKKLFFLKKNNPNIGLKLKMNYIKSGIYLKNFFRNKKIKKKIEKKYLWIIVVKRRNFFLTFLDKEGNVLVKANSGWFVSGKSKKEKKKKKNAKFTGYAINLICKKFYKKIYKYFLKSWLKYKLNKDKDREKKKIYKKIKKYYEKINIYYRNINVELNKKSKIRKKIKNKFLKNKWRSELENLIKWEQKKKIKKEKKLRYFLKIYNYFGLNLYRYRIMSILEKWYWSQYKTVIHVQIRSVLSSWVVRYINSGFKYGMSRLKHYRLNEGFIKLIEKRIPLSHSQGLRVKKQRRI